MGLVTKNSILLVDFANQERREGASADLAMRRAGPVRLRPILMTALSLILAMIPIVLGLSEGGEFRQSMSIAIMGGMITSTLLTLFVVPVFYSLVIGLQDRNKEVERYQKPPKRTRLDLAPADNAGLQLTPNGGSPELELTPVAAKQTASLQVDEENASYEAGREQKPTKKPQLDLAPADNAALQLTPSDDSSDLELAPASAKQAASLQVNTADKRDDQRGNQTSATGSPQPAGDD